MALSSVAQLLHRHRDAEPARGGLRGGMTQRQSLEGRAHVDRVLAERELGGPGHLPCHRRQQLFGKGHQPLVVHVGPVKLEHRELGVVLRRNTFIPEVTIDLENAFDAPDGEPLEIQLRRDAEVELHVERVVMRREGARQGAAGDRLHHRRLDFKEPVGGQELANRRDRAGADLKHAAHVGIDREIEIALAVAHLDVLQAVPLLRQREETLGEKLELRRPDRQFVGLGSEEMSGDADLVAARRGASRAGSRARSASPAGRRPARESGHRRARGSWPCRSCECQPRARP